MKKILLIILGLVLVVLGISFLTSGNDEAKTDTNVARDSQIEVNQNNLAQEVSDKVAANQAVLLDVRTPEEFNQGHSQEAINYDSRLIDQGQLPDIDKNKTIYLYCRSGNRSTEVQKTLEANGFTNIVNLGGLSEMKNLGLL